MSIKEIIKKYMPIGFIYKIRNTLFEKKLSNKLLRVKKHKPFCIFFISTPFHGNLGDQAIVYAQERFFFDHGFGDNIIEFNTTTYLKFKTIIKKYINPSDLIVIDGGGSMGTLWLNEEYKMRQIITDYPDNLIFIFPQSIYYDETQQGIEEMKKSVSIYTKHRKLYICAREKKSYELMKKIYPTIEILLIPDMVLYLNPKLKRKRRAEALCCFRTDKEKIISTEDFAHITGILENKGLKLKNVSTIVNDNITKRNRKKVLYKMWNKFSSASIVITDRLHGMLFSAITATPCLFYDNISHKVSQVYDWINELPYLEMIHDCDAIEKSLNYLLHHEFQYNNEHLMAYFNLLFDAITSKIRINTNENEL